MKKVITPGVREEYETLCDVTGKPAAAGLVMWFWYGSDHDGDVLRVDLSNEVAEDILKLLQSKYPQFQPAILILRRHVVAGMFVVPALAGFCPSAG